MVSEQLALYGRRRERSLGDQARLFPLVFSGGNVTVLPARFRVASKAGHLLFQMVTPTAKSVAFLSNPTSQQEKWFKALHERLECN